MAKTSAVTEAYARCKDGRKALIDAGARCMEATEDKCGILWERWLLPNLTSAILYATPHGWDVFTPVTKDGKVAATVDAIKAAATAERVTA